MTPTERWTDETRRQGSRGIQENEASPGQGDCRWQTSAAEGGVSKETPPKTTQEKDAEMFTVTQPEHTNARENSTTYLRPRYSPLSSPLPRRQ